VRRGSRVGSAIRGSDWVSIRVRSLSRAGLLVSLSRPGLLVSGRAIAPDGGVSTAGVASITVSLLGRTDGAELFGADEDCVLVCTGSTGRGSRPLNTRDRRSSSSNATPGVRSAAPVGLSGNSILLTGAATRLPSPPPAAAAPPPPFAPPPLTTPAPPGLPLPFLALPPTTSLRRGKPVRSGSVSSTRRAIPSSTGRGRSSSLPKSRRGTRVTPRHVLCSPSRATGRSAPPPG
jgi:hypothetical protein